MSRAVRLGLQEPIPATEPREEQPRVEKTREERFAEAQVKILESYAETFRRLAE